MLIDTGLLILRVTIGLLFVGHGSQKLFGAFGGPGMTKFTGVIEKQGFRPAPLWAWASALAEFGGGLLMTLGLFTPIAAALIISVMVMAIAKVHGSKGLWNTQGGYEFNLTLIAIATTLGLIGPGVWALDSVLGVPMMGVSLFIVATVIALIGDGVGVVISNQHPQPTMTQKPM